jgi:LPS sulfotransferase NodH
VNPQKLEGSQQMPSVLSERSLAVRIKQEIAFRERQWRAILLAAKGQRRAPTPVLVFTTSRSGSTWLCELLYLINESGPLPEHIRPQHFKYAMGQPDGQHLLRKLFEDAAALIRNGRCGGSKLIWDYVPELFSGSAVDALGTVLSPLSNLRPICLRLRRRDIAAQAVSRSLSSQTGIYHRYRGAAEYSTKNGGPVMENVDSQLTYDTAVIAHHERVLQRAESHLEASISGLGLSVHEVVYEELVADPGKVLEPLIASLRPELSPTKQASLLHHTLRGARVVKNESLQQIEWLSRYRADRKA